MKKCIKLCFIFISTFYSGLIFSQIWLETDEWEDPQSWPESGVERIQG